MADSARGAVCDRGGWGCRRVERRGVDWREGFVEASWSDTGGLVDGRGARPVAQVAGVALDKVCGLGAALGGGIMVQLAHLDHEGVDLGNAVLDGAQLAVLEQDFEVELLLDNVAVALLLAGAFVLVLVVVGLLGLGDGRRHRRRHRREVRVAVVVAVAVAVAGRHPTTFALERRRLHGRVVGHVCGFTRWA